MSDSRALQSVRASRRSRAATLAALALTAGAASVWAQNPPATPAAAAQAPAKAAVKREVAPPPPVPKARTPRQMAEGIIPILQQQKTPWQLYPSYETMFTDFADQEKALAPPGNPADAHAKRAEQLRVMAALLASMGEQAKARDAIKRGQSTLPPENRQSAFVDAGKELARLLDEFSRLTALLPPAK